MSGKNEVILSGSSPETTNNRMELMGPIEALKRVKDSCNKVSITTDSQYVKNGITMWIKNWKKNGWRTARKKPVFNKELWVELDDLCSKMEIEWKWVRGHSGHLQNETVDKEARRQAESVSAKRRKIS